MTGLPEMLARLTHTASQANVTMTVDVADMRTILAAARLGQAYLWATEAWAACGRTTPQDLPVRLTPRREAALADTQDQALTAYQTANLALADELRTYRQDHP